VELAPGTALPHFYLGWAYAEQGKLAEAIAEAETAMGLDAAPDSKSELARLHAIAGGPGDGPGGMPPQRFFGAAADSLDLKLIYTGGRAIPTGG